MKLGLGRRRLRRRYGHAATKKAVLRRFTRAELIAALGLEPEGSRRGDKYAATTGEFADKVRKGTSPAVVRARRILGLEDS